MQTIVVDRIGFVYGRPTITQANCKVKKPPRTPRAPRKEMIRNKRFFRLFFFFLGALGALGALGGSKKDFAIVLAHQAWAISLR